MSIILEELEKRVKEAKEKKILNPNYNEPHLYFDRRNERAYTLTDLYDCVCELSKYLEHLKSKTVFLVDRDSLETIVYLLALLKNNVKVIVIKNEKMFQLKENLKMPLVFSLVNDNMSISNLFRMIDENELGTVNIATSGTLTGVPKIVNINFEDNIRKLIYEKHDNKHNVRGVYSSIATISGLIQALIYPIIFQDVCFINLDYFEALKCNWIDRVILSAEHPLSNDFIDYFKIANKRVYFTGSPLSYFDYSKVKSICLENVELYNLFGSTESFGEVSEFNIEEIPNIEFNILDLMKGKVNETNGSNLKIKLIPISKTNNCHIICNSGVVSNLIIDGVKSDCIGFEHKGYIYCVGRTTDIDVIDNFNLSLLKQYLKNEIKEDFVLYFEKNDRVKIICTSYYHSCYSELKAKVSLIMKSFNIPYTFEFKDVVFSGTLQKASSNNLIKNLLFNFQKFIEYLDNHGDCYSNELLAFFKIYCDNQNGKIVPKACISHDLYYGKELLGKYTEIAISLDDYINYEEYQNVILELLNKEYNSIEEIIEQIPFDKEFYVSNVDIKKENKLVYGHCGNLVTNELYPNTTGYNDYYIDYIGKKKKNLIITPTHKKFGITVEHNLFDFIINRDLIFFYTKLFDEKILELSRNKKTAYVFIDEDILLIKNSIFFKFDFLYL